MQYRAEIDGLRALAVIPVILFHAGFSVISGGFIGVDIFFVISGYLITSILISELANARFSLADFYLRRARRILPVLFLVVAVSVPFSYMLLMPRDFDDFAQSVGAVSIFSSNILFWMESGYFDTSAELKPLLHTWSLAVEEQFYIFFPLFLMASWRWGKKFVIASIVLIAVISLAVAHWGAYNKPTATYYLLPTRAWELLMGSLVAFYLRDKKPAFSRNTAEIMSLSGFGLIMFSFFAYDSSTPFPSLYALVPIVGVCLLIVFTVEGSLVYKLLASRLMVGIGLISYSAYLWHQPVLALAKYTLLDNYTYMTMVVLCLVVLVISYLSWRFVEAPFRSGKLSEKRFVFPVSGIGLASFVLLGFGIDNRAFFDNKMVGDDVEYISYLEYNESDDWLGGARVGKCFLTTKEDNFAFFNADECLDISDKKADILLFGDSHAAHLNSALLHLYPNTNVLQATSSGCLPLLPLTGEKRCVDLNDYVFNTFLPEGEKLDVIILSGRWQLSDSERLEFTLPYLNQFADKIFIIGPTVEYSKDLPTLLVQASLYGAEPEMLEHFRNDDRFSVDGELKKAVNKDRAEYLSVIDTLCSEGKQCQSVTAENVPIAFDYGHFTFDGAVHSLGLMGPMVAYINDL
ncbi:acyltransferase [Pseudomonas sp. gcc21]|uniref:acyltransferase family protein n=1 Tax=Pseudomonas sp. gcc21 TaxID=2726989 RepID=UPI001452009F|nr:acyltransferase family protein [Pseudomonas sp. gcc21]QJD59154.1 acyltransferase [Pseudomonas sp. gcc21]